VREGGASRNPNRVVSGRPRGGFPKAFQKLSKRKIWEHCLLTSGSNFLWQYHPAPAARRAEPVHPELDKA